MGTVASSAMSIAFAAIVPLGTAHGTIILVVGGLTFLLTVISAIAAFLSPETYRMHRDDLGVPGAQQIPKDEYDRLRAESLAQARAEKAARR